MIFNTILTVLCGECCVMLQMPTIQVFLMDGSSQQLSLVSNANTTVQQLHVQMMKVCFLMYLYFMIISKNYNYKWS